MGCLCTRAVKPPKSPGISRNDSSPMDLKTWKEKEKDSSVFSIKNPNVTDATEKENDISDNKQETLFDERSVQVIDKSKLQNNVGESSVLILEYSTSDMQTIKPECEKKIELVSRLEVHIEPSPLPTVNPAPYIEKASQVLFNTSLPTISKRETLLEEELKNVKQKLRRAERDNVSKDELISKLQHKATKAQSTRSNKSKRTPSLQERREAIKKNTGLTPKQKTNLSPNKFSSSEIQLVEPRKSDGEPNLTFQTSPNTSRSSKTEKPAREEWEYSEYMVL